jgi:hypothetical protein
MKWPRDVSGGEATRLFEHQADGSHVHMAQGNRRVTIPLHRNLVVGTLQSILRQAGVSLDVFLNAR